MERNTLLCVLASAALFLGSCTSWVQTSPIVLPPGALDAAAVRKLFSDTTAESVQVATGTVSQTYYEPSGEARQLRDGRKRTGVWRVNDEGRMCLRMEEGREKCRIIVLEDGSYQKYVVKSDNQHERVVTYRSFRAGNPLGL